MLESIEEYKQNIAQCNTEDEIASQLEVAVMTVCASIGCPLNLVEIYNLGIPIEGEEVKRLLDGFTVKYTPNAKRKDGQKTKAFYNCLNVIFPYFANGQETEGKNKSNISAKVFPNGSIQIAGCKTIESVHAVPQIIFDFVERMVMKNDKILKKIDGEESKELKLNNVRISMINSNFVFKSGILQERLKNLINENKFDGKILPYKNWRYATFQPEKYSGVNARYWTLETCYNYTPNFTNGAKIPVKGIDGQLSVFVFRSGKGTITAAKNTNDLLECYQAITDLVRKNQEELFRIN